MDKLLGRFKKNVQRVGEGLELIMAVIVLVGILLTIFSLLSDFEVFRAMLDDTAEFKPFLEDVFVIVIGIEFLQMLCRPNSDNVMEVLIFLVARHMIVGDTTPFEDFISVISVGLLCLGRRYLHVMKEKEKEQERQRARESEQRKEQEAEKLP
ncbi:MAG: phosphate-starvation-inducible PsiE family protein [Lachnospiraceae bacterium]|nr:phosphate-starvation-inducible PsiE family protein [Lachnospiraceae bacterium]